MSYGKSIKKFRKELGLTQQQFASTIGYSFSYIAKVEGSTKMPGRELLTAISNTYKVSIDELLGIQDHYDKEKFENSLNNIRGLSTIIGSGSIDVENIHKYSIRYKGQELSEKEKTMIIDFVKMFIKNR